MSLTPFGEHLKREREMRGVSLEEISAATRISTRFLEALENGQWDQLPGGAFNRGFIRSTARFLGLNEDSMVAEYALEMNEQADGRASATPAAAAMPRDLRPLGAAIGALVLLVGGLWYGYHRYRGDRLHRQFAASARPVAKPEPAPAGATTSGNRTSPAANGSSGGAAATPGAPDVLKLKIEAGKTARVKVVADGKTVFDGRMRARSVKLFAARDGFQITSPESGVLLFELNGQSVRPSGSTEQPGFTTLSRKDLKPAAELHH
jgi:cytoskeleton protein RodZ